MESDIVDDLSDDLIRDVFTYLSTNKYPEASSSSRKRVIRKKALKFFISTSGELMYKQKLKGKMNPLPHQIIFDQIDGVKIRYAALKIEAIAAVTRRLCSEFVDPEGLSALVGCRLIALDKNPGVRPIGIGETLRRIIARAVLSTFKDDILMAAGPMQLCAGQESGCEAAVHVMQKLFNSPEVEAVLLVDATNAFNSINRQTALCPVISTILINTYRDDVNLL
ncbi:hypothetical protein EMCRGX_G013967 [Ephydatia muelleri]